MALKQEKFSERIFQYSQKFTHENGKYFHSLVLNRLNKP